MGQTSGLAERVVPQGYPPRLPARRRTAGHQTQRKAWRRCALQADHDPGPSPHGPTARGRPEDDPSRGDGDHDEPDEARRVMNVHDGHVIDPDIPPLDANGRADSE